ncbi:MAG: hypothetical protein ACXVAY_13960 [Mucilaginibacter sp.]
MKKIIIILAVILTSGLTAWAVTSNSNKSETVKSTVSANTGVSVSGALATAD